MESLDQEIPALRKKFLPSNLQLFFFTGARDHISFIAGNGRTAAPPDNLPYFRTATHCHHSSGVVDRNT